MVLAIKSAPLQLGLFDPPRAAAPPTVEPAPAVETDIDQLGLFGLERAQSGAQERPRVRPAALNPEVVELAAALPPNVRFGTSSWSFPGWGGLVYDHKKYTSTVLSRHGLAAYGRHPLLRTVGLDRTFYGAIETDVFRAYAAQVPSTFRFLVKAQDVCTTPFDRGRSSANPHFLDPVWATDTVVRPYVEGLEDQAGPMLFQFPPLTVNRVGGPDELLQRLNAFLDGLPKGPWYAVELRNRELFTERFYASMQDRGVTACLNVHPAAAPLAHQRMMLERFRPERLVVRWMLRPDMRYGEAKEEFAPFAERAAPDDASVDALADVLAEWGPAAEGVVIVNNKAEGSSPRSIKALASRWRERLAAKGSPG
jgi:uncharacterized protein YecE (DUF72 family)